MTDTFLGSWLDDEWLEPSVGELWDIEPDADVLVAELAVVDADAAWRASGCGETSADLLEALLVLADARIDRAGLLVVDSWIDDINAADDDRTATHLAMQQCAPVAGEAA